MDRGRGAHLLGSQESTVLYVPDGLLCSSWSLVLFFLLPSVDPGNAAGFEAERQPLVVHSNPASGGVLGARGVGAKTVLAVPAGVCQDELPVPSSGTHSCHPLRLSQGSLPL